jgi:hypothetical protein
MEKRSGLQRFLSVYDTPMLRDWLFWLVLVVVAAGGFFAVRSGGPWSLLGVALSFAVYGWVLGIPRNFIRGYREVHGRSAT